MDLPPSGARTPEQIAHDQAFARAQLDAMLGTSQRERDRERSGLVGTAGASVARGPLRWLTSAVLFFLVVAILGMIATKIGRGIL